MTNSNKIKGDGFERACVEVLRAHGHLYVERVLRLGAREDRGDITGIPGYFFDCKNRKTWDVAVWMDELVREADGNIPTLIIKRPRAPAERAYVIVELATFADMIRDE